jgi:2-furoyl-CoA dehydrogenase large subunit
MSVPACIANAIADALGVRDVSLPASPKRIHGLMGEAAAQHGRDATGLRAAGGLR